jgi:hypothetical protein
MNMGEPNSKFRIGALGTLTIVFALAVLMVLLTGCGGGNGGGATPSASPAASTVSAGPFSRGKT